MGAKRLSKVGPAQARSRSVRASGGTDGAPAHTAKHVVHCGRSGHDGLAMHAGVRTAARGRTGSRRACSFVAAA